MILLVAGVGAGLTAALLRGGSLASLATTRFRWAQLLVAGLAIQIIVDVWDFEGLAGAPAAKLLILANLAVLAFVLANLDTAGMKVAAAGVLLNLAVITANGAMPVSESAAERAGIQADIEGSFEHEYVNASTRLPWLGDVIPIPGGREVFSIGDAVLAGGIAWLVYARTRARNVRVSTPSRKGGPSD